MKKNTAFLCLTLFFSLCGCMTLSNEKSEKAKEEIQERIRKFTMLRDAVSSGNLQAGAAATDIRGLYGDPADIFSSGSSTGSFEIWTYEEISTKNKPLGIPIRLYINNGKLVSWSY